MLAAAAGQLGYRIIVMEPGEDCPAAQMANRHLVAAYDDAESLAELARSCDVITYEFENVPLSVADVLAPRRPFYPPKAALEAAQDRKLEKETLEALSLPVSPWLAVETAEDLERAVNTLGPGILKTRRLGYDGKGQQRFSGTDDQSLTAAVEEGGPFVYEQMVPFEREFSIVAVRGADGEIAYFDASENYHKDGILRSTIVPAHVRSQSVMQAKNMTGKLLQGLNYCGVIAVEFFETADAVFINEFAPRVHNSGHWTHECCPVSQFAAHIRAVCGLPIGALDRFCDTKMTNLIGDDINDVPQWLGNPAGSVTLYGKSEARAGRKMGHVVERHFPVTGSS